MRSTGLPVVFLFGALFAGSAHSADLSSPEERLTRACRDIMGFSPGESRFDGCMQSLGRSLQRHQDTQARSAALQECLARGLKPGMSNYAPCVRAPAQKVKSVRKD